MKCIYFILLLVISTGCNRKSSSYFDEKGIPVIDIEKVISGTKQEYLLSEIALDIEYIPLEFTPECPLKIGLEWDVEVSSSDIFVLSGKVYRFDRNGKYLNSIGSHGRGPGEYVLALGFAVDTVAGRIYLHSHERQIHVYDYSGKHIRSIRTNNSTVFNRFYFLNHTNELFCLGVEQYALHYPDNYVIKSADTLGNIRFAKNSLIVGMLIEGEEQSYNSSIMQDGNTMLAIDGLSDTLFCYRQSALTPYLIFNYGRYKNTVEKMRSYHKENSKTSFVTRILGSTPDYLFIFLTQLTKEPKQYLLRYDKSSGECSYGTFVNNLDGGFNTIGGPKNQWISARDAFDMIEKFTPEYLSAAKAANPQAKQRLQQLVKNLKPEDNPVLMRVILKP